MSQEQSTQVQSNRSGNQFVARLGSFMETAVEKTGWLYRVAHRRNVVISTPQGKRVLGISLAWAGIAVIISTFFSFWIRGLLLLSLVAAIFFGVRFHIERKSDVQ